MRFAPDYPEARNNLGLMHRARWPGRPRRSPSTRKALALNPGLAAAHDNLGVALVMLGKRDEAIAEYEAAIRLDPNAALFRSNLGAALYGQGRAADAIAPFTEALRLNPVLAPAHTGLALALTALGRLGDAIPTSPRPRACSPARTRPTIPSGSRSREQAGSTRPSCN